MKKLLRMDPRDEVKPIIDTGMDFKPKIPECPAPVLMSWQTYQSVRHRYWCHDKLTEVSGTGIDVVPQLPKCPVPVWMSVRVMAAPVLMTWRTYRSVRYRYWCGTENTEVSGTGMKLCTGTGGTGIVVVPKVPKCPVPVLMSYRSYRNVRYRYSCRTGNTGGMPRYVPCRTPLPLYAVLNLLFGLDYQVENSGNINGGFPWTWKKLNNLHILTWFLCESDSELQTLVESQK